MDDAWRHVFRYFRAAERIRYERVSKLWMRLLREYWKQLVSIDTNDLCVGVPAEYWSNCVAAVLERCSRRIKAFNFVCSHNSKEIITSSSLRPYVLANLIKKGPELKSFRVWRSYLDSDTASYLQYLPPTLKVFCLEFCAVELPVRVISASLYVLFDRCKALQEVTLTLRHYMVFANSSTNMVVDDRLLEKIPPTVTTLVISDCALPKFQNECFTTKFKQLRSLCITESNLGFDVLERLVFCTPNLLHLDLSSTDINDFSPIAHLRQLRCLLLNDSDIQLTNTDFCTITASCRELELLSLQYCSSLSNAALMTIRTCAKLKELYIGGITGMDNKTFAHIVSGTPLLRVLDISCCVMLTREGLSALCTLTNLDHLCVSGVFDFDADLLKLLLASRCNCTINSGTDVWASSISLFLSSQSPQVSIAAEACYSTVAIMFSWSDCSEARFDDRLHFQA